MAPHATPTEPAEWKSRTGHGTLRAVDFAFGGRALRALRSPGSRQTGPPTTGWGCTVPRRKQKAKGGGGETPWGTATQANTAGLFGFSFLPLKFLLFFFSF